MLNTGPYRYAGLYAAIDEEGFRKTYSLLPAFYREGTRETVLVAGASGDRLLITNGAVESSDRAYRPTQVLLARLPMLFRPGARTVYACGSGVGITAGTLLGAGIDTLVCVEPERARLEAMRHFASVSGEPWNDPRARFTVGEPRRELARENPRFDIIVCGSARPSDRNAAHLDTKEFYAVAASRLRPAGIASASFPLAGIREDHLLSLLAAFRAAFPHVLLFETAAGDALLALGSGEPLRLSVRDLLGLSGNVTADTDLRESDLRSVHDLVARALLDGELLDAVSAGSRPNRDGSSFVESGSEIHPRGLLQERDSAVLRSARFDPDRFLEYEGLSREERGAFRLETARAFLRARYAPGGLRYAERAFEEDPTGPASSFYAHLLRREAGDLDSAIAIVRAAWERDRHDPSLLRQLGDYLFFARRYAECDGLLTEAIEDGVTDAWCYVERGKARLGLKQYDSALQDLLLGKELDRLQDNSGDINYFIGMAYKNLGKLPESKDYLSRAIERSPRHIYARLEYGESRALLGEIGRAEFDSAYAVPFNRARAETLFDRAVSRLYEPGRAEDVERDLNAVVNTTPRHFGAYLALAEFYHRGGKPEKEREALGGMFARLGSSPELRKHVRDYLRRTGGEARVREYRDLLR
jgi:spermidine synthase/tetratricopeptide (TPR) repeat protein